MTDLEKFIELYKGFGIDVKVFDTKRNTKAIMLSDSSYDFNFTNSDKFDGYSGFFTDIEFDNNGKFLRQGFWE